MSTWPIVLRYQLYRVRIHNSGAIYLSYGTEFFLERSREIGQNTCICPILCRPRRAHPHPMLPSVSARRSHSIGATACTKTFLVKSRSSHLQDSNNCVSNVSKVGGTNYCHSATDSKRCMCGISGVYMRMYANAPQAVKLRGYTFTATSAVTAQSELFANYFLVLSPCSAL